MSDSRKRTPEEWHAMGQFWTQMAFALCLVGAVGGVLYSVVFVTQPVTSQAPNDAVLFKILEHVLTSMVSIIGTLMAVGHGSNATAMPAPPKPPIPQAPTKPLSTPPTP